MYAAPRTLVLLHYPIHFWALEFDRFTALLPELAVA
jgi:hypothetical protein